MEARNEKPGIYPVGQYEMATRLSYFLWSTVPDEELVRLAAQGRLQDPKVLTDQVDRMLDDPRFTAFTSSFINQWLGFQAISADITIGTSWFDGQPCFVMQYPKNAPVFGGSRDELREIAPNTWLGRCCDGDTGKLKSYFLLQGR